ncbi:MAG: type IV toxin-antitoxin system AbiEi family antitoxin domain-containing protein [Acidimicrobiaceae bacterium]|nr:type IV toxin-antitoxin system AbiEi family antitoxin domain-containing protein [Acidimicrobiaceae bacterium]
MAILSYMSSARLADLPEIFTHADARSAGWSDRDLYAMRDRGDIERLARGIYAQPELTADPDLVEIVIRAPDATLCLTSALACHDLTDEIPSSIHVALPRTRRSPRTEAPATWHRFGNASFELGRTELAISDGLSIGLYSPARSIVDAYRLRHLYGTEQALDALKRWLQMRGNQPSELLDMARRFPKASPAIRGALQTLL